MPIGILAIIIGCLLLTFTALLSRSNNKSLNYLYRHDVDELSNTLAIISIVVGVLLILISIFSYMESADTVADLEAFYENTATVYEEAIEKYKGESVAIKTYDGSNTYKTYPGIYTEKIEWYNSKLRYYQKWQDHWFLDGFLAEVPSHLKPIRVMPGIE